MEASRQKIGFQELTLLFLLLQPYCLGLKQLCHIGWWRGPKALIVNPYLDEFHFPLLQ
jgi:hypothetical protein